MEIWGRERVKGPRTGIWSEFPRRKCNKKKFGNNGMVWLQGTFTHKNDIFRVYLSVSFAIYGTITSSITAIYIVNFVSALKIRKKHNVELIL